MASYPVKNAAGDTIYIDTAQGSGTQGSPFVARAIVEAVDLDIRNIQHGTDSISVVQSGIWNVTASGISDLKAALGAQGDSVAASDTATASAIALQKRELQHLSALIAQLPASLGQKTKDGSLSVVLASNNDPLPVSISGLSLSNVTVSNFPTVQTVSGVLGVTDNGGSLTVDGTVAVSNHPAVYPVTDNGGSITVDGGVTILNSVVPINDNGGSITVDGAVNVGNFPANQTVSVSGVVPINDNNGSLTVDGTVNIGNFPATQPVSFANLPAISGSVAVTNHPATYPVTDNGGSLTVDGVVAVTDNNGSLTVDGTVTANIGTIGSIASQTTLASVLSELQAKPDGNEAEPFSIRGKMRVYRLTPTVTSGVAYAANDAISNLITLSSAVPSAGMGTFIHSVQVNTRWSPSFIRLIVFDANPSNSTITDTQDVNIVPVDQEKIAAVIPIDAGFQIDGSTFSANQATSAVLPKAVAPVTGTTLYLALQATGANTFTGVDDLDITLILYDA